MIDIHTHILYGVDDGARDLGTAVVMAQMAQDSGVTDIIATPHANQRSRYENYVSEDLDDRLIILNAALRQAEIDVKIHPGMEVYGTPDLPRLLRAGKVRTLGSSRYLLVEFAFREDPFFMEETLRRLQAEGVKPIVAHPERYTALQSMPDVLFDWVDAGLYLQVNKGSLSGAFGRSARHLAHFILAHDLAAVVASDAHDADHRTTDLSRIQDYISMEFSHRRAERLLEANPRRILRDEALLPGEPIRI